MDGGGEEDQIADAVAKLSDHQGDVDDVLSGLATNKAGNVTVLRWLDGGFLGILLFLVSFVVSAIGMVGRGEWDVRGAGGGGEGLARHCVLDADEEVAAVLCEKGDGHETKTAAEETGFGEGVGYVHEVEPDEGF